MRREKAYGSVYKTLTSGRTPDTGRPRLQRLGPSSGRGRSIAMITKYQENLVAIVAVFVVFRVTVRA